MAVSIETKRDHVWSKIERGPATACWLWRGRRDKDGYGNYRHWVVTTRANRRAKGYRAHRLIWHFERGPIPDGMQVLHRCDNRLCCNPAHLFLGTNWDNMQDRNAKGRTANGLMPAKWKKLTAESATEIRKLYATGLHSQRELAARFHVSQCLIYQVLRRLCWKDAA